MTARHSPACQEPPPCPSQPVDPVWVEVLQGPLISTSFHHSEGCGPRLLDTQELADFLKEPGFKLCALVNVEVGGGPILGEPASHQGVSHRGGHLIGQGESLYKLCKAVDGDQDVFVVYGCLREGAFFRVLGLKSAVESQLLVGFSYGPSCLLRCWVTTGQVVWNFPFGCRLEWISSLALMWSLTPG